jgi:outer membrane protein OmpA-like peptidoglycan-associated protein
MKSNIRAVLTIALGTFFTISLSAQNNLVPNGSFEQTDGRIRKGDKAIEDVIEWFSPDEENGADVYSKEAKDEWAVPENKMGYQMPLDGQNYVGVRMFGYRGRTKNTFIQVRLKDDMIEGKTYCVNFNIVLSKISRYATNNIGGYLSGRKVRGNTIDDWEIKPQIMHPENKIFKDQYMWKTICGTYTAKGGEKYLTIGNFTNPEEADRDDYESMRRVKGYDQLQTNDAYYFVDDVSVYNMEEISSCTCEEEKKSNEMQVVYSENVSEDADMDAAKKLSLKKVYFDYNSTSPSTPAAIIEVIRLLEENKGLQVKIIGHSSAKEAEKISKDISAKRAKYIHDYLIKRGIDESRLSFEGVGDSQIVDDAGTDEARAKNRRVTFEAR